LGNEEYGSHNDFQKYLKPSSREMICLDLTSIDISLFLSEKARNYFRIFLADRGKVDEIGHKIERPYAWLKDTGSYEPLCVRMRPISERPGERLIMSYTDITTNTTPLIRRFPTSVFKGHLKRNGLCFTIFR